MEDTFWELITKYLSKEATEKEINNLFSLLESNKEYQKIFDETTKEWNEAGRLKPIAFNTEKARLEVISKIQQDQEKRTYSIVKNWNFLKVAAMIAIMLGSYYVFNTFNSSDNKWEEFKTAQNEKLRVVLPDSSIVWLNENTSLSYNFQNQTIRNIKLDGEAFFDVNRNEEKPFIIVNPFFTTKVLGTSFNINSRKTDDATISVVSGKVSLNTNENEELFVLEKGYKATYNLNTKKIQKEQLLGIENEMAWINKKFVFENIPLERALKYLSQNYKTSFKIENENLKECLITGTFNKEPLKNILAVICGLLDCEYTVLENDTILISGNGCPQNNL